jgi:DNA-binding transcriptional ArsR family regulator
MELSDSRAIRALAHPLRLDLLEVLAKAGGPTTAAACGRILGVSQANCSFHLRQLAKYGFVEDAGPGDDRRERLWQVVTTHVAVDSALADPVVAEHFNKVAVRREFDRVLEYMGRVKDEDAQWREAAGGSARTILLTVEEVAEIQARWRELLAPYAERTLRNRFQPHEGERHVRLFMSASPAPEPASVGEPHELEQ